MSDDLFDPADPDLTQPQPTPGFLLRVAGATIRTFLGWHLSPNRCDTIETRVGSKGIVPLPSRHVTYINGVVVNGQNVPPSDYWWSEDGWLELRYYQLGQRVTVIFEHGYDEVPDDVKAVALEVVRQGQSTAPTGGNISSLRSPGGYAVSFNTSAGTVASGSDLSEEQRLRLANYRIFGLA